MTSGNNSGFCEAVSQFRSNHLVIQTLRALATSKPSAIADFELKRFKIRLQQRIKAEKVDQMARGQVWLQLSGGHAEICSGRAADIFEVKCEDMYGLDNLLVPVKQCMEAHDCFTVPKERCCYADHPGLSSYVCKSPLCGRRISEGKKICCYIYANSRAITDMTLATDPSCSHVGQLPRIAYLYSLFMEHDYQTYACLNAILKGKDLFSVDTTLIKASVSALVLRFYLRALLRLLFRRNRVVKHLLILYDGDSLDPADQHWIFIDWQRLLFEHLSLHHVAPLIDRYLVFGPKEMLFWMCFYFAVLFTRLQAHPDTLGDLPKTEQVVRLLLPILQDDDIFKKNPALLSMVKKLRITNKTIKKLSDRLLPVVITNPLPKSLATLNDDDLVDNNQFQEWPSMLINTHEWKILYSWLPSKMQFLTPTLVYSSSDHGWSLKTLYCKSGSAEPIIIMVKTACSAIFGGFLTQSLDSRHTKGGHSFGTGETFVFSIRPNIIKHPWVMIAASDVAESETASPILVAKDADSPITSGNKYMESLRRWKGKIQKKKHLGVGEPHLNLNENESYADTIRNIQSPITEEPPTSKSDANLVNDIFIVANDFSLSVGGGDGCAIWLDSTLTRGSSTRCNTFKNEPFVVHKYGYFDPTYVEVFSFVDSSV